MYVALGIATAVYVAIAIGVYATLTVDQVIASGGTAVAEAAKPTLGQAGYVLMAVTALFSTAGATNSCLYPSIGLSRDLATKGQFPPLMGRDVGRVPFGLGAMVLATLAMAPFFDLNAIASIGSAVALIIFTLVTVGHIRVREQTGARLWVLLVAVAATSVTLISFAVTTLPQEPGTAVALVVLLVLAIVLDLAWASRRGHRPQASMPGGLPGPKAAH